MTPDEGQGRAEALVRNCTIRTHDGMTTVPGEKLLIAAITAALRAERIAGEQVVTKVMKDVLTMLTCSDETPWCDNRTHSNNAHFDCQIHEAIAALRKAIREQARRAG